MSSVWNTIFDDAPQRSADVGATLFRRGDSVRSMYLVLSGRVTLTRMLTNGTELALHVATPGTPVAEASLFSDSYHCDAVCNEPTVLAVLPKAAVHHHLVTHGHAMDAMQQIAHELQGLRARVEIMRLRRIQDRLDAYLALRGTPQPGRWVDVADWIGVTPPALYRELAKRRKATI